MRKLGAEVPGSSTDSLDAGGAVQPDAWRDPLPARRLAAFSLLSLPTAAASLPVSVYLPAIYAQLPGMSLAALGGIFLAERLWGTFSDPIVGVLCDRTRSRFGARKIWILSGGLLFALATVLMFFPPQEVSPTYLVVVLFVYYLAASMIQIPYMAWAGELSRDYHQRTRVATFVTVMSSVSLLLVLALPVVVDQFDAKAYRLKLAVMGGIVLVMLAAAVPSALLSFADRHSSARGSEPRMPLGRTLRLIAGETLLLRIMLADMAIQTAASIRGALIIFFVSEYMGAPRWAGALFLVQFVFGMAAGPIWLAVAKRIGKHRAATVAELYQAIINCSLLLVAPGSFPLLLGLTVGQGLAQSAGGQMLRAMVADVADKYRLENGQNRTALFYSALRFSEKAGMAVAIGIALPLVGWLGFNAKGANSPEALRNLALVFALGPALGHLIAAAIIRGFPLDEARHREIQRELERRAQVAKTNP